MTQHVTAVQTYLHDAVVGLLDLVKTLGRAMIDSRMNQALQLVRQELMKHYAYRQTYNELNSLSDKELYDIGLDRSKIHSIALESIYNKN